MLKDNQLKQNCPIGVIKVVSKADFFDNLPKTRIDAQFGKHFSPL